MGGMWGRSVLPGAGGAVCVFAHLAFVMDAV